MRAKPLTILVISLSNLINPVIRYYLALMMNGAKMIIVFATQR